jgi:hypothetical protein
MRGTPFKLARVVIAVTVLMFAMGHGGGCCEHHLELGPPTGTLCPSDSTLTYENFGMQFMTDYCVECHDSNKSGDDRMGAPAFHDFDTQFGIQAVAMHIDQMAGAGPNSINEIMPQEDPKPSLEERYLLAEWLACGAP